MQRNQIAVLIYTIELEGDIHSVALLHLLQQSSTGRHIKHCQGRVIINTGVVGFLQSCQLLFNGSHSLLVPISFRLSLLLFQLSALGLDFLGDQSLHGSLHVSWKLGQKLCGILSIHHSLVHQVCLGIGCISQAALSLQPSLVFVGQSLADSLVTQLSQRQRSNQYHRIRYLRENQISAGGNRISLRHLSTAYNGGNCSFIPTNISAATGRNNFLLGLTGSPSSKGRRSYAGCHDNSQSCSHHSVLTHVSSSSLVCHGPLLVF